MNSMGSKESLEDNRSKGGPPWIDPQIQQQVKWRDGDIVISVPLKSGTTWMMNIVYQLLTGGSSAFQDIYAEVPWIECLSYPGQPIQEALDRVEAMPMDKRRAFKTHSAPPSIPFIESGSGRDVKYIVVARNPEEALVSLRPFLEQHTDDWFDLWRVDRQLLCRPDFPSFYREVIDPNAYQGMFFGFLSAWWPLRHDRNVLLLHYSNMKRHRESAIGRIANFLGIHPTPDQWPRILEYTSFDWMKQHEELFEIRTVCKVPMLKTGAMVRRGKVGNSKADGMTDEIKHHLRNVGRTIVADERALQWLYEGGDLRV